MTTVSNDRADLLVGRFFRLFGAIETELNEAIRKLFELTPDSAEMVCANIDFVRKIKIVRSALADQDKDERLRHKKKIEAVFSEILRINNDRLIAAHASFKPNENDGVVFYRVTADKDLKRTSPTWTEKYCEKLFSDMEDIRGELQVLAQSIAPYHPSLDFSDRRNSQYITLLF